jgi:hypothetical protein
MNEERYGNKEKACVLHIFKAEPNQLGAKGGTVRLSWISENCTGCRFVLDIPGAGLADVSDTISREVTVKKDTTFTLRVYAPAPSKALLWEKSVKVVLHKIWGEY